MLFLFRCVTLNVLKRNFFLNMRNDREQSYFCSKCISITGNAFLSAINHPFGHLFVIPWGYENQLFFSCCTSASFQSLNFLAMVRCSVVLPHSQRIYLVCNSSWACVLLAIWNWTSILQLFHDYCACVCVYD